MKYRRKDTELEQSDKEELITKLQDCSDSATSDCMKAFALCHYIRMK